MNNTLHTLIEIIKSILHGSDISSIKPVSVEFQTLYIIAKQNSVANTIADVICSWEDVPEDIKDKFRQQKSMIMAQQALSHNALQELFDSLDEHHIHGIFLKGTLLRNLYSNPFLRSMSDVDVYAEESDMDAIYSLMVDAGYEPGTIGSGNHYEYSKYRMVKIEYHPELVTLSGEYGQKVFAKKHPKAETIAAYMDIWSYTLPIDGHEYARQLTPEYHYLYVIMHMMGHFLTAGTGIRSIMDVWVMNNHYADIWDRQLVEQLLEDFGLRSFERYALALADKWFDLGDISYLPKTGEIDSETLNQFEDYILGSGTYGNVEQSVSRQMNHQTGTTSKLKYLSSRFFLPYDQMKKIYPVLEKYPVVLPAMWVRRVVDMFHTRGQYTKHKLKAVTNPDKEKVEKQRKLMEEMIGL